MRIQGEEVFFIPYLFTPAKVLVYAPLRSLLALTSAPVARSMAAEDGPLRAGLLRNLRDRQLIDIATLHRQIRKARPELSLALTDNCNLRCLYCHASAGEPHKQAKMPKDTVSVALEAFFQGLSGGEARVTFAGGGEPTHNLRLLSFAIHNAKALSATRQVKCLFKMATNACYPRRVQDFVLAEFSEVSISLDGPRHIQDLHRPQIDGSGSFDQVMETANRFRDSQLSVAFRVTVSSYSIHHIAEIVRFFGANFPGATVGLEPLNPQGRAMRTTKIGPPSKRDFAEALLQAYRVAQGYPVTLVNAGIGNFETLRTIFCGAVGIPCWTVTTGGRIACCTRDNAPEAFTFGKIDSGKVRIDQEKLEAIAQMNIFSYRECDNCFCKYHCAGDCPDLRLSGLTNCLANRRLGQYVLSRRIAQRVEQIG